MDSGAGVSDVNGADYLVHQLAERVSIPAQRGFPFAG